MRIGPVVGVSVDGIGDEQEVGALGNMVAGDGGVSDGLADSGRDGGIEAEGFLAHAVEVGHALQQFRGDVRVVGWYRLVDLGS